MAGELLNTSLGVRVTHMPYKGENPRVADLLGGQIPYMFSNFPVVLPHVRSSKLRAVAITSPKRTPRSWSEVQKWGKVIKEAGVGME